MRRQYLTLISPAYGALVVNRWSQGILLQFRSHYGNTFETRYIIPPELVKVMFVPYHVNFAAGNPRFDDLL